MNIQLLLLLYYSLLLHVSWVSSTFFRHNQKIINNDSNQKNSNNEDENICCICLDHNIKDDQIQCNKHAMHKSCASQWTAKGKETCPMCRKQFSILCLAELLDETYRRKMASDRSISPIEEMNMLQEIMDKIEKGNLLNMRFRDFYKLYQLKQKVLLKLNTLARKAAPSIERTCKAIIESFLKEYRFGIETTEEVDEMLKAFQHAISRMQNHILLIIKYDTSSNKEKLIQPVRELLFSFALKVYESINKDLSAFTNLARMKVDQQQRKYEIQMDILNLWYTENAMQVSNTNIHARFLSRKYEMDKLMKEWHSRVGNFVDACLRINMVHLATKSSLKFFESFGGKIILPKYEKISCEHLSEYHEIFIDYKQKWINKSIKWEKRLTNHEMSMEMDPGISLPNFIPSQSF